MQLTNEQLLQIVGQKEIDIYALKVQIQQLQEQIQNLTDQKIEEQNGE